MDELVNLEGDQATCNRPFSIEPAKETLEALLGVVNKHISFLTKFNLCSHCLWITPTSSLAIAFVGDCLLNCHLLLGVACEVADLRHCVVDQLLCPLHEEQSDLEYGSKLDLDEKLIKVDFADSLVCGHCHFRSQVVEWLEELFSGHSIVLFS